MILPFSTKLNGKETFFVEKILRTFLNEYAGKVNNIADFIYDSGEVLKYQYADDILNVIEHRVKPKLHTIREDKKNRWKAGVIIDFYINVRQKTMFQFAPKVPVVSTQEVEIKWFDLFGKKMARIFIDKKSFSCVKFDDTLIVTGNMLELAQNDGFDTIEDFFAYFKQDYKGKIIHWTDLKY